MGAARREAVGHVDSRQNLPIADTRRSNESNIERKGQISLFPLG